MKRWLMEAWKVLLNLSRGEPSPVKTPSLLRLQSLPDLGTFRGPVLELVEELVFLLLAQRPPATCLLALLDETGEVRLEPLHVGAGGYSRVALQPLRRRRKTPPAGQLGHDIDLMPFRVMPG